jgi:uncharacterized protein YjbI with pentapeptide repeats
LRNANLTGAIGTLAYFDGSDMTGAKISRAEFYGAGLSGVVLEKADLTDARFDIYIQNGQVIQTVLDGANMRKADLSGSMLAGATLAGVDLSEADFSRSSSAPVTFVMTREVDGHVIAFQAKLNGANLSGADFRSANLALADLQGTILRGANFQQANLRQANLSAIDFSNADLRGANLSGASLDNTNLSNANLAGANLSETDLSTTNLDNVTLVSTTPITFPVDLRYAGLFRELATLDCIDGVFLTVEDSQIKETPVNIAVDAGRNFFFSGVWRNARMYICAANLQGVVTSGKRFNPISMAGVNLNGADLRSTDLSQVEFVRIIEIDGLSYSLRANLTDIIYNSFTTWPAGFIPPPSANE